MVKQFDDSTANALETAGYFGAGIAAFLSMWATVRDTCYRQVKKMGVLDKAIESRAEAMKNLGKTTSDSKSFFEGLGTLRSDYRQEIDAAYKNWYL